MRERSVILGVAAASVLAGFAAAQTACPGFQASTPTTAMTAGQSVTLTLSVVNGVRFQTSQGTIDIDLMLDSAPNTSANFLNYVRTGRYDGVMFHRSVPYDLSTQIGVIQGGGYTTPTQAITSWPTVANPLTPAQQPRPVVTDPPIAIEHPVGNVRGTIAMARTSEPVSATSQFFINTVNNNVDVPGERFSLDAIPGEPGREGYSVFGTVTPASLAVVDSIKNRGVFDLSGLLDDWLFSEVPLRQAGSVDPSLPLLPGEYVTISAATQRATAVSGYAPGAAWTYRWRRNGVDLVNGGRISGATTGTLLIADAGLADEGTYVCVVSNLACTGGVMVSSSVVLTCPADMGSTGGVAGADGALDNNDFIVFINDFFDGDHRADMGVTGGVPGSDGVFDNNDFIVYIDRFFSGC